LDHAWNGKRVEMLTILLLIVIVLLLTGGIGYGFRGRRGL
jgi:flagellar basal body-associated protein FliL